MVESFPAAVAAVDPEGRIARVNAAAERLFGYRRHDLVGSSIELLIPFGMLTGRARVLEEYLRQDGSSVAECTARRSDGAEMRVEVTRSELSLGTGTLVTIRPADDPHQISERLAVLEAFVETSEDAVFSQDPDGCISSWNRSSERIFGYTKYEILWHPSILLFPEHVRPQAQLVFDSVTAGDRIERYETEINRKDGMPIPITLSLCPLYGGDGRLSGSVLIARDVTEQRLAQATLAEISSRLLDGELLAHVGGWLWDIRTGTMQWTDELHRIYGVDPLDFDGTLDAHLALVHPEDQDRVWRGLTNAAASGRPFQDEYRVIRPDGTQCTVYARAEPTLGSSGDVVGLRGIAQDVTHPRPDSDRRVDQLGFEVEVDANVGVDPKHQHGRGRQMEITHIEGVIAGDD
jgi:PAS domain S-box-containing protein